MPRTSCRKRPCKVCHRWFLPDLRVGGRQKTCASEDCKKRWHQKQCKKWNRKNKAYFKGIYLQKKLAACKDESPAGDCHDHFPAPRTHLNLPRSDIAEVMTPKGVIATDYIIEQVMGRMRAYPFSKNFPRVFRPVEDNNPP